MKKNKKFTPCFCNDTDEKLYSLVEKVVKEHNQELVKELNQIVEDWIEACLADNYRKKGGISPLDFELKIEPYRTKYGTGWRHWFEKSNGEGQWQPIETAPKDGTLIIVGWDVWDGANDWSYSPLAAYWSGTAWKEINPENGQVFKPTHWMPIPSIPGDII